MPIVIQHQPVGAIAEAGLMAGLGQYRQRQQAAALQQQQLAQNDAHFQQNLAAQLYGRQQQNLANQQSQLFQAAKQAEILGWQRQNQQADQQTFREQKLADFDKLRELQVADANLKWERDQTAAQKKWDDEQKFLWEKANASDATTQLNATVADMANNIEQFGSADQPEVHAYVNQWKATAKNPAVRSSPKAMLEAAEKFQQDLDESGLMERRNPKPNTMQQFGEETAPVPGIGIVGRDRSGAWRKIADDPISDFVTKNLRYYQDEDKNVDMDKMLRDAQSYAAGIKSLHGGTAPPPAATGPPTPKKAQTFDAYWDALPRKDREQHFKDASTELMKGDRLTPPTPQEVLARVRQNMTAVHGFGENEKQPPQPFPKHIDEIPESMRQEFVDYIAKPQSAAEAKATLKPGTPFMTPDGRIGKMPQ
jgi:hypothetical protein